TGKPEVPDMNKCGSDNFCSPTPWGLSAFLRASIFFGGEKFRLFAGPEIGAGSIRHAVAFNADKSCGTAGTAACVDSIASGPVFIGGAFGFLWAFNHVIGLLFSLVPDVGFPKFTFNLDGNLGLALHF